MDRAGWTYRDGSNVANWDGTIQAKRFLGNGSQLTGIPNPITSYSTGWVSCNDWTNQHLGDTVGGDVTHSLNTHLSGLLVKVFISTDGTDATSYELLPLDTSRAGSYDTGLMIYEVDANNVKIQTGVNGINILDENGNQATIDTEAYYYQVVVYKLSTTESVGYTSIDVPVGSVQMYGGSTAPTGWLLCDGSSLLRAGTYANLYAVISTTFGSADATHFNIPDMRGIFPRGAGTSGKLSNANGVAFSGTLGTYQNDKLQGHYHETDNPMLVQKVTIAVAAGTYQNMGLGVVGDLKTDGTNGTPRKGAETNPANLGVNFIIKY